MKGFILSSGSEICWMPSETKTTRELYSKALAETKGTYRTERMTREANAVRDELAARLENGEISEEEYEAALEALEEDESLNDVSMLREYSITDIQGENGDYGRGVLLDTNIFDGVKENRWGEVLGRYVCHKLAGKELTLHDESGNTETVYLARENDRVKKKSLSEMSIGEQKIYIFTDNYT